MAPPSTKGYWPGDNGTSVPSVTRRWKTAKTCMCITCFPISTGARTISRICGWCITTATARFTAPVRLLEYVDGLSRVLCDWYTRFCGEEVIAISPPYPTTYTAYLTDILKFLSRLAVSHSFRKT
jgi:hypothetical protein